MAGRVEAAGHPPERGGFTRTDLTGDRGDGTEAGGILQAIGGGEQILGLQRGFAGAGVGPLMIFFPDPLFEGVVELFQAGALKIGQEAGSGHPEEALDFPPALRGIGRGMDQRDPERGADAFKMLGSVGGAVIDVELTGQPPAEQGLAENVEPGGQPLG